MEERGFTENEVLMVLNEEVRAIVWPSSRDETFDLYFSKSNSKYLLVVVDRVTHSIITVRPMRTNEIATFKKELENG
jgi:hypothetical protein